MKNTLISVFFLVIPQITWACAVCFGKTDGNLQRGFFWGILMLILLPPVLFLIIAGNVYFAMKKKKQEAEMQEAR